MGNAVALADLSKVPVESLKIETHYCISEEQRLEHVRLAVVRGLPTIEPYDVEGIKTRGEPIAIACYGPSLRDTIEEIRKFRHVMSMSGSHDVLLEHGIRPTWHVECDPRPHKLAFYQRPRRGIEYLISSCCHPMLFDRLAAFDVRVWHLYGNELVAELPAVYPRGEFVLTGGGNVGLRCLVLARFFGFTDLQVFGMDNSFPDAEGGTHAGEHPNQPKRRTRVRCGEPPNERFYWTTETMVDYAQKFFHEMGKLVDCHATLHGVGLLQNMAYNKLTGPITAEEVMRGVGVRGGGTEVIAIAPRETISHDALALNRELHQREVSYGMSGAKRAKAVLAIAGALKTQSVLDYGCGKSTLAQVLPFPIWEYDPAIPGKDKAPRPADLVVCTDVLEHVEERDLDATIADVARCTRRLAYFLIHTGQAQKTLADGRNAHVTQRPPEWWMARLGKSFHLEQPHVNGEEFQIIGSARGSLVKSSNPSPKPAVVPETKATVAWNGGQAVFMTPTETTRWRAKTLLEKEPVTVRWIDRVIAPGEILLDVGANVGGYSVLAGLKGVEVWSIEPEAANHALLVTNLSANGLDSARAVRVALSDKAGRGELRLSSSEAGAACHELGGTGPLMQPVEVETIDRLIASKRVRAPDHIKIDVDGIEPKVLAGATKALRRARSLLIEVDPRKTGHAKMVAGLAKRGFHLDPEQVAEARRRSGPFEGCAEHLFRRLSPAERWLLDQIAAAEIRPEPFPHLYIEGAFPEAFYAELLAALRPDAEYTSLEAARGTRGYPERSVREAPDLLRWMRMGSLRLALCRRFGVAGDDDETLLIRDRPGYRIGPHTDTPAKVVSALFYLSAAPGLWRGTSLYAPRAPGFSCSSGQHHPAKGFKRAWTAPGAPNSLLAFARTDRSFHGAERFAGPGVRDLLLFDVRRGLDQGAHQV